MGAGSQGLGDIPGELYPSVGDHRDTATGANLESFANRRHLRDPNPGHHPGSTDRARTNTHLHGVYTGVDEGFRPLRRGYVAGNQFTLGEIKLRVPDGI